MRFKDFYIFLEAIRLKDAKNKRLSRKSGGAYHIDVLKDVFGNKDRLVYDLDLSENDFETANPLVAKINRLLELNYPGFKIKTLEEYKKGIIFSLKDTEKKQGRKIGKLLQAVNDGESIRLLDAFKKDPSRLAKDDMYKVVISRHPYDIAGMSTDRNWRSCMTLDVTNVVYNEPERRNTVGVNKRYVPHDISEGSIVAYLVSSSDVTKGGKVEIRRPLSRILMKPFENVENSRDIAYSLGKTYGAGIEKFSDFVREWLLNNVNKNTKGKKYFLNRNLYPDNDKAVNFTITDRNRDMGSRIFFEELNYWHDNSKSEENFEFLTLYNDRTDSEIKISFNIPKNVPLDDFLYSRGEKKPKYINDILNLETLPDIDNFHTIETFGANRKIVIQYQLRGDATTYEDDKGDEILLDDWDVEEQWSDVFKSNNIRNINYLDANKSILEILSSFSNVKDSLLEEEKKELISKMNDKFDENSTSTSPNLKAEIKKIDDGLNEYLANKKYFDSLANISFEDLVELSKTDDYKGRIRQVHTYMRDYMNMLGRLSHFSGILRSEYPLLGNDVKTMWTEFLNNRFPVRQNIIKDRRMGREITAFMANLRDYSDAHGKEDYQYLRSVLDDQETAFNGATYALDVA
jgi:hypothetical protein